VSFFRVEVAMLESGGIYIGLEEGKVKEVGSPSTCEFTRLQIPEEKHYYPHRRENLKCYK
jgi:hypothetical protein